MTPEKVKQVVQKYRHHICAIGDPAIKPTEYPSDIKIDSQCDKSYFPMFLHILWMCDKIEEMITHNQIDKSMRRLGFIQGVLWTTGLRTIDQLKEDNREE